MGGAAGGALQTGQRIGSSIGAALLITVYEVAVGPTSPDTALRSRSRRAWSCSPPRWRWRCGRCATSERRSGPEPSDEGDLQGHHHG